MDARGAGAAGADAQREEDEHTKCPAGAIRFSGVHIRAAREPARGRQVHGVQSVAEEREPDQAEGGRTVGSPERGHLGGSLSNAESAVARLAAVLLLREHESGVSGGR